MERWGVWMGGRKGRERRGDVHIDTWCCVAGAMRWWQLAYSRVDGRREKSNLTSRSGYHFFFLWIARVFCSIMSLWLWLRLVNIPVRNQKIKSQKSAMLKTERAGENLKCSCCH